MFDGAYGLNHNLSSIFITLFNSKKDAILCSIQTLMSKNDRSKQPPQNLFVATSSLALSSVMAEAPVSACLSSDGLRRKFYAYILANFGHQICGEVSDLIMLYSRKPSLWRGQNTLHRETGTTGTSRWGMQ